MIDDTHSKGVYQAGPRWLEKAALLTQAKLSLESFMRAQPEIQSFKLIEALKVTEKNWVFSAKVNGEKVAIKKFLENKSDAIVRTLKQELDHLETVMKDERLQANRCLYAWPGSGVVVLSFAPGMRLGDKILETSGTEQHAIVKQSGEWLRSYCAGRTRETTFGPAFWVKKLRTKNLDHISNRDDLLLLQNLHDALQTQIKTVRGAPVMQGASHGDFVGINAHYHRGTIYGVDIQGECWIAIAREAARFLVWLQIHDQNLPITRQHGIAAHYWAAFVQSNLLSISEQSTTLPFFVGEQLYGRFVENYAHPDIRRNARPAVMAYLDM